LIDIADNGLVYFNHINPVTGDPEFVPDSKLTPSPVHKGELDPSFLQKDTARQALQEAQFPLQDIIRFWEAPRNGTITITAPVQLVDVPNQTGNSNNKKDGVRVSIQTGSAPPLWSADIAPGDFSVKTPTNVSGLTVTKGQRFYFRLQSVYNGEDDRVQLAQGDIASALNWAADRRVAIDDDLTYLREYEHITLARTLIAESGDRPPNDSTTRFLERLLDAAQRGDRRGSVIEILILLAVSYDARGDRQAATTALDQALVLAEPEGYVRLFIDAGPALISLLKSAQPSDDGPRLARRLLATTTPIPAASPPRRALVDELSGRELDVLRLLRSDLSGPEIARELHVSLNTLRTHTKSIYTKLGATNRREAIRLAAEHGH
jgi:DNA-binding CsgD family transcriptional regulator